MEPYRGSESSGNLSLFFSSLYSPQSERYIARGGIFLCNFSKDEFHDAFVWTNEFQNLGLARIFLFFFFSYSFSFLFSSFSLFLSLDEGGRKETKPWIGEEKLKEGGRKGRGLRGWASIFGSAPENVLACW